MWRGYEVPRLGEHSALAGSVSIAGNHVHPQSGKFLAEAQMRYKERHKKYPNTVIVSYPFARGGQFADRRMWMAELNGDVLDYNPKDALISGALQNGYPVIVLRVHRGGDASVVSHLIPVAMDGEKTPPLVS